MWAVWIISMIEVCISTLLGFRADDGVSASLFVGFRYLWYLEHNKQRRPGLASGTQMCRGSNVKDKQVIAFQLESLILAQNERWRQA